MDLKRLYGGSFVDWEAVGGSWAKRTVSSRLLLLAARRYLLESTAPPEAERAQALLSTPLPDEVRRAYASPPEKAAGSEARCWGEFVDAAAAAELETVSYGERPPLLHELKAGLEQAATEAGRETDLGRWFLARRDALPGEDLPEDPGFLPV